MNVRTVVLLTAVLTATGCTADAPAPSASSPRPVPSAEDVCASAAPTELPARCVEGDDAFDAVPSPTGQAPANSAAIAPLTLPSAPGDLASGGNDTDPGKTSQTFVVVVPAGHRLVTTATCEGRGSIDVTVQPSSAAAQQFTCGFEGEPAELTVEDSVAVEAPTRFTVTVRTQAPSRWFVAVGSTDEPAPPAPV